MFTLETLSRVGGQPQAMAKFMYFTEDTSAEVLADGYFDKAKGLLRINDVIYVKDSQASMEIEVTGENPFTTILLINYSATSERSNGWVNIVDTTKTISAPLVLTAGVRTLLDLNSDSVIESYAPTGTTAETFYNSTSKKLFGENVGDTFIARLVYTADPATTNTFLTFDIDIGGTQNIIFKDTRALLKGSDAGEYKNSFEYFTLGTFQANGGDIYVTSNNNCNLYNIGLFITRTSAG